MNTAVPRLITELRPTHYDLHITQDAKNLMFSGLVKIAGMLQPKSIKSGQLTLHSSELTITSVQLSGLEAEFTTDEASQELRIAIPSDLTAIVPKSSECEILVEVVFNGVITKPMHGLYPCFFTHEGAEKRILATQFESHHAREVFPCIDEPEAKATFQLTLTTDAQDTALSNTPITRTTDNADGTATHTFEVTPLMSTYLLAWVSGELIYEEAKSSHGVTVRTYATPLHAGKLSFAVETACRALDFMDDYFGIPYPLAKCDQVALPDFAAGAMENWGCITYRESALLVDPEHSDLPDKQYAAEVIIHELSHQWFGNLVTMRWWNDLWLNEGFASWVPYLVRDALFPEWNVWERFATGDLAVGLRADSLANTHPIVVDIHSPEEIRSAFDSISYDKGCSVINLLYHYIGAESFQSGLRDYLKTHAYGNAETYDLWSAWDKASGKDVSGFMKTWTEKAGYPIVKVTDTEVSQTRFFLNPQSPKDTTIWPIPLMRYDTDQEVLLNKSKKQVAGGKINVGQSGFYRAIYEGSLLQTLTHDLHTSRLSSVDSLGLIADASEAAKAGYYSTTETLALMHSVRESTSEQLIDTVLGELGEMRIILSDTFDAQKPFVADFIEPNLSRLGIEQKPTDSVDDELLRPGIIAAASFSGNRDVITWALETFASAKTPEDIRPDLRGVVYQTAVREQNDRATYDKLYGWYKTTTIPGERTALAASLSNFKDASLAKESIERVTGDEIKLQDSLYWIAYSLRNRWNKQQAWEWMKQHWDWVEQNFAKEKEVDYYLRYCASGFATKEHLRDYTDFFTSVDIFGSSRAFEQGKETIQWQSAWKERDTDAVEDWLKNFTK